MFLKKICNIKIILLPFILFNLSFIWPVKEPVITSSFGESRGDHFHDGIDFVSSSKIIHPVEKGKLVFLWDKSLFPTEQYPGGGNYRIIDHEKYFSIYMHLEDNPGFKYNYNENDELGLIGSTGHSTASHLHLSLLKKDSHESVNPLILFPAYKDTKSPVINDIYVRIENTYYRIRNNESIRLTKHYPLLLDISDNIADGNSHTRMGIYELSVEFNGKPVLNSTFSGILSDNNGLTVKGRLFQELFDEKGFYKVPGINYIEGTNTVKIIAADYSGNRTTSQISFKVDLDLL
jgi:hypothetical protein